MASYLRGYGIPGHLRVIQDRLWLILPLHFLPPFFAFLFIVRFRSCDPTPQVLEHEDHRPQVEYLQLT